MKKYLVIGIIILISISPLFRGLIHEFETYAFFMLLDLLCVLYIINKIVVNEVIHINKRITIIGLLLIIAYAMSFIKSVNVRENINALFQYAGLLLLLVVLYDYFREKKQRFISAIMLMSVLVSILCAIIGFGALIGIKILGATATGNRLGTTFQYANTAALYFAICILFVITLALNSKKIILEALLVGVGNIISFAFFLTGSRGGCIVGIIVFLLMLLVQPDVYKLKYAFCLLSIFIPIIFLSKNVTINAANHNGLATAIWIIISFLITFTLYFGVRLMVKLIFKNAHFVIPKNAYILIGVMSALIILLAIYFRDQIICLLPSTLSNRLRNISIYDINILFRLEFDKDALKIIADNWILGLGRGGWLALFQRVQNFFYNITTAHNNYLEIFIEAGIIGFIAYILLLLSAIYYSIKAYIKEKDTKLKIFYSGLLCALVALIVHSSIDFDLTHISMALLLWSMLAAAIPYTNANSIDSSNKITLSHGFTSINSKLLNFIIVIVCSIMFSMNAIYFTAALNEYYALKYMEVNNYKYATAYYEEAYRLDPMNSMYSIELTKLYLYFGKTTENKNTKSNWLKKARYMAEKSVKEFKYYPYYINTLVRVYLASDMPLQALENSQKLVSYQKYLAGNYELLAESYITAAEYYEKKNDVGKSKELLEMCLEIDSNPYLKKSNIVEPEGTYPPRQILEYKHSPELTAYLDMANKKLERIIELNKK